MTFRDFLIRFIVYPAADGASSRLVYRPRSQQLVEYIAHAGSTTIEQIKEVSRQPDNAKDQEHHRNAQQKAKGGEGDQRNYVDHRIRELAAFEQRVNGQGFQRRTGRRMKK